MKQAGLIFLMTGALFALILRLTGYGTAYKIGYGAISLMGVMIAVTFLWLWKARATPLALGMAFSWAGSSAVMGWWWIFNALGAPQAMVRHPALFVFLAVYITGALLHFAVIQRSLGYGSVLFVVPVGLALAVSGLLVALLL